MRVTETKYANDYTGYRVPEEKELVMRTEGIDLPDEELVMRTESIDLPDAVQLRPTGAVGHRIDMSWEEVVWLRDGLNKCLELRR